MLTDHSELNLSTPPPSLPPLLQEAHSQPHISSPSSQGVDHFQRQLITSGQSVSRIMQKVEDGLPQHLVEGCSVGQERTHYIMVQILLNGWIVYEI